MGFKTSEGIGRSGEKLVLSLLTKNGIVASMNEIKENRSFYDIIVQMSPRKKAYIECKYDVMSEKTGNIAIEYHNCKTDTPSGINITKANIYSYTILDTGNPTVWFASVPKLKDFLKTVKPFKTIKKAGDGNASLYLYKVEVILDAVFSRMENILDTEKFQQVFKSLLSAKNKE
jgi:hypothetical protein